MPEKWFSPSFGHKNENAFFFLTENGCVRGKKVKNNIIFAVKAGESTLYRSLWIGFDSLTFARHVGMLCARRKTKVVDINITTRSKYIHRQI